MFSWLVQPQSCIPYVQTGLMTWLYKRILFLLTGRLFFQWANTFWTTSDQALLFFLNVLFPLEIDIERHPQILGCIWVWHYDVIILIYTFWCVIFKFEKSTCIDLELFSSIPHTLVQLQTLSIADCRTKVKDVLSKKNMKNFSYSSTKSQQQPNALTHSKRWRRSSARAISSWHFDVYKTANSWLVNWLKNNK